MHSLHYNRKGSHRIATKEKLPSKPCRQRHDMAKMQNANVTTHHITFNISLNIFIIPFLEKRNILSSEMQENYYLFGSTFLSMITPTLLPSTMLHFENVCHRK